MTRQAKWGLSKYSDYLDSARRDLEEAQREKSCVQSVRSLESAFFHLGRSRSLSSGPTEKFMDLWQDTQEEMNRTLERCGAKDWKPRKIRGRR
jgi:hypothetical protein